jgi:hypothetical protein
MQFGKDWQCTMKSDIVARPTHVAVLSNDTLDEDPPG